MNSPQFQAMNDAGNPHQTPVHSDSPQLKMKKLWKKLMGHKKAGKLFRLGLQQLTANQPEYFLVISKKFISQGQHSKAFNILKKQIYKDDIDIEYKPIIMHHYMHTCYKLMQKLIKNKAKEILEMQEQQDRDPFSLIPNQAQSHKKKSSLSRLDKLNAIIEIQFENLQIYENIIINLVCNYETYQQQNDRKYQKLDSNFRSTIYQNNTSDNIEPISDMIIQDTQQGKKKSLYSKQEVTGEEDIENKETEKIQKKHFDVYQIEAFKENYLLYFFKTILLMYKHYKQEGNLNMALKFIEKGYQFIMSFVDSLFGDFISMEIYRLCGDIIQIKANTCFESQNITEALKYYDQVFKYYRFSGQILLKKFHSQPLEEVDTKLELKCEFLFCSLSITTMMQALCYEHQFKFEKMIEALQISDWINMKFLVYEFSDKLRVHVTELLQDAKSKYSQFLEEKGEIRRVLLQAFPEMQQLEKQEVQDNEVNLMNKINNYLYEKGNIKSLNQNSFIIYKKQEKAPTITVQQEGQYFSSQENFDHLGSYMIQKDQTLSYNNMSNKNLSQIGFHSPERVKDIGSQSFSDVYNMNSLNVLSNHNNSTTIGLGNSTVNTSGVNNIYSQFSNQNGHKRTSSGNLQGTHIQSYNSPKIISSHSLNINNTTHGYFHQNSKAGVSLHQINEIESVNDYGISGKRPSGLQISTKDTPKSNQNTRNSFKISHSQSTRNANDKEKGFFQSHQSSGMSLQKRYSTGNLVIRSNRPTHEQPAPLYTREHSDQYKPKMLTTNKYFQKETYASKSLKTLSDFQEITQNCAEQEQKFHYLNLLPIKQKLERNQGVLSLDYAMENLIKEKIIQYEIKNIQHSVKQQTTFSNAINNTPFSSNMSNSLPNQFPLHTRYSHHETLQPKSPIFSEIQMNTNSPQSMQLVAEANNQIFNKELSTKKDIFCDRAAGKQIRNLMNSLNISNEDQILIINDLEAKFEAEKRSIFTNSKSNQSKVSQQGWTTDKILEELLKSINILGENVNTYNQRFSQFLMAIKDEDFDKSEFHTCLKKLQFRQRMGNGIIPQFFNEREQPLARIQERRKIDDEYSVIQGGGERMVEIMSDHKIIKNLFFDESNNNETATTGKEDKNENSLNAKDQNYPNKHITYNTAVSILGNENRSSKVFDPIDEQKNDSVQKPQYKQKKKKMLPVKTSTLSEMPLFNSSDSSVEKMMQFGQNKTQKVNYFQKSQEALRQMVLKSEQDYEEMQKEILNPRRNKINSHRNKNLQFSNFTNKLAISTSKYNQKEKIKKSGNKLDLIDFMRIQNKWRQKVQEKHGTIVSQGTSEAGSDSPNSTLTVKFKKASKNFILANAMNNHSSIFGKTNTYEQK